MTKSQKRWNEKNGIKIMAGLVGAFMFVLWFTLPLINSNIGSGF